MQIKFRGKSLSTGEWVYGYYIQGANNKHFIEKSLNVDVIEVDPKTVGQYVGLKDKNGKEIYEGDVLTCEDLIMTVYWNPKGACFWLDEGERDIHMGLVTLSYVTSSIHDTPDLLTQ